MAYFVYLGDFLCKLAIIYDIKTRKKNVSFKGKHFLQCNKITEITVFAVCVGRCKSESGVWVCGSGIGGWV